MYVMLPVIGLLAVRAVWKVGREFRARMILSTPTVVEVWALYMLHAALTVFVAWRSVSPLPTSETISAVIGGVLLLFGLWLSMKGIGAFRSLKKFGSLVFPGVDHKML